MLNTTVRRGTLAVMLVFSAACRDARPTSTTEADPASEVPTSPAAAPTPYTPPAPPAPPAPSTPTTPTAKNFPPLTGPSRTFTFDHELLSPAQAYTKASRLILYDNGAFVLAYSSTSTFRGAYTESHGAITFDWEGSSTAGAWGATGTLSGDLLTVQFNVIMLMTDFEDAVYKLAR